MNRCSCQRFSEGDVPSKSIPVSRSGECRRSRPRRRDASQANSAIWPGGVIEFSMCGTSLPTATSCRAPEDSIETTTQAPQPGMGLWRIPLPFRFSMRD